MMLSALILPVILQLGGSPSSFDTPKQAKITDSQKEKNITWKAFLDRTFSKDSGALAIEIPAFSVPVLATPRIHSLERLTAVYNWDVLDTRGATILPINQAKEWGTTGQHVVAFCNEIKNMTEEELASLVKGDTSIDSLPNKAKQFVIDYCVKNSEAMRESYLRGDRISLMLGQEVDAKVKNLETGETKTYSFSGVEPNLRSANSSVSKLQQPNEVSAPFTLGKRTENPEFIFSESEILSLDQLNMKLFSARYGTVQYDKRFGKVQLYLRGKFKANQLQEALISIASGLQPIQRVNGAAISELALQELQDKLARLMDNLPIRGSDKKLKDLRGTSMTVGEASALSKSFADQQKGKGTDSNDPVNFGFRLTLHISGQGTAKDSFGQTCLAGMGIILGGK